MDRWRQNGNISVFSNISNLSYIYYREADPDPIVKSNSSADSESGAHVSLPQYHKIVVFLSCMTF